MKNIFMLRSHLIKFYAFVVFYIIYILYASPPGYSDTNNLPAGAKYIALGGINSTNTDDVYSVYYNPANLDKLTRYQASAEFTGMHLGINSTISRSFLGCAIPSKRKGSFGVYWDNFSCDGYYSENTIAINYSKIRILEYIPKLDFGMRLKGIFISYSPENDIYNNDGQIVSGLSCDSIFENGTNKIAYSFDIGFLYNLAKNYRIGLYINDLFEPNISLVNTNDVNIPRKIFFGLSNINTSYGLNLDFGFIEKDIITSFSVEKKFKIPLSIFGSIKLTNRNYTTKLVQLIEPSLGAEYRFDGFDINYAFNYPVSGLDNFGNHTISILYKFGPVIKYVADTAELENKVKELNTKLAKRDEEISELRKKLDELLREGVKPKQEVIEKKSDISANKSESQKVTEAAKTKENIDISKQKTESEKLQERYYDIVEKYFEKKDTFIFKERMRIVQAIYVEFKGKIDISKIQKEYEDLKREKELAEKELEQGRNYYIKLKNSGISKNELLTLLNRMIKKYENYGINLDWIEKEKEMSNR